MVSFPRDFAWGAAASSCQIDGAAGPDGNPEPVEHQAGRPLTAMGTAVTPEALYWRPKFYGERYQIPVFVTENGMSDRSWISLDGGVHDAQRIDFLHRHLLQLYKAIEDGVEIRGYSHWSLLGNFEWAEGHKERFSLVYVDYPTQRRVLKDSAYCYKCVIASNGGILDLKGEEAAQTR